MLLQIIFPPKSAPESEHESGNSSPSTEKRRSSVNANLADRSNRLSITEAEWTNASRAFRTATWAACFYLITTDILGPFGVGYAVTFLCPHLASANRDRYSMGTLGWGPGVALFTVFGLMAG